MRSAGKHIRSKPVYYELFIRLQALLIFLSLTTEIHFEIVIAETLLFFYLVLSKLGEGIVFREIVSLHAIILLLIGPVLGYQFYTNENYLARIWNKSMPIQENEYFFYVLPAVLIFNYVLCYPILRSNCSDQGNAFKDKIKLIILRFEESKVDPRYFIIIGSVFLVGSEYLPSSIQYVGFLIATTSFVGLLMLYFNKKILFRRAYIAYLFILLVYLTAQSSMFTLIAYMGLTTFSFFILGKNWSFAYKVVLFASLIFLVIILQLTKVAYRELIWVQATKNQGINELSGVFRNTISEKQSLFSLDRLFPVYVRFNQGLMTSRVLKYIPEKKNYDNGSYLLFSFLSSLIPRFIWPEKMKSGGSTTMQYFTGERAGGKTSMNISPVGEAYGSFGFIGGIVYLIFLAFFIRTVYINFFKYINKYPFLLFWFPVIFYQVSYCMESDSLQIFNSLIKSTTFIFIIFMFIPKLFK